MRHFFYNAAFRKHLQQDAHHYGEVTFLESITRKGMTVIEAGAYDGVTGIALARAVGTRGRVYAFEPVPEYYGVLQENLTRNKADNVKAVNQGLSDRTGTIAFYKHGDGSGITEEAGAERTRVKVTTVPDFLRKENVATRIDLFNMDCEGSELHLLRGAKEILARDHPQIFCEVHHGYLRQIDQSVRDLVSFLEGLAYTVRPLRVEDREGKTTFPECSHVYAYI